MIGKFIFNNRFKPPSDFKKLSQISFFKKNHTLKNSLFFLIILIFPFLAYPQFDEINRAFNSPYTGEWRPSTADELSFYVQSYDFFRKNPGALEIIEAAQNENDLRLKEDEILGVYRNLFPDSTYVDISLNQQVRTFGANLADMFNIIRDNSETKAEFRVGINNQALDTNLGVDVDLTGVARDFVKLPSAYLNHERIEAVAQFYTQDYFTCESGQSCYQIYHPLHKRSDYLLKELYLEDLPKDINIQELKVIDPNLADVAEKLMVIQFIPDQIDEMSQEQRTNRDEFINSLNRITKENEENLQSFVDSGEYERRRNLVENDPDYTRLDSYVQAKVREIKVYEESLVDQKRFFENEQITQEHYEEEVIKLNEGIKIKRKSIEAYEFQKDINNGQAILKIALSAGRMMGAPPEVLQTGEAIYLGLDIMKSIGIMAISGVVSPAGLLAATSTFEDLINEVSGIPSSEQLILEGINDLKRRQVQMFNKLYELEFALNIVQKDLNEIKNLLEENAQQTQQGFDEMKVMLQRVEFNIGEKLDSTRSGQQSVLAEGFTTESESVTAQDQLRNYSISEILDICNDYGEKSNDPAFNRDFAHREYIDCMRVAQTRIVTIAEQLSDSYIKLEAHASGETFLPDKNLSHVNSSIINIDTEFKESVNERMNYIPDMLNLISGSSLLRNQVFSAEHFSCIRQEEKKTGGQYECLSNPYYMDKAFLAYAELSDQLPSPEYSNTLPEYARVNYSSLNQNLENMCTEAHSLTHISESMRKQIDQIKSPINYIETQVNSIKRALYNDIRANVLDEVSSILSKFSSNHKCHENNKLSADGISSNECLLLGDHIESKYKDKDNTDGFLRDTNSIVANFRNEQKDDYFIKRGYAEIIETDECQDLELSSGRDGEPYTRADFRENVQKEDFKKALNKILESGGCLFNDVENIMGLNDEEDITGQNASKQFHLEHNVSFVNRINVETRRNIPFCLISENIVDGNGVGKMIGAVIGGAAGLALDVITAGASGGAGVLGGVGIGAGIGGFIDGTDGVYSICLESDLKRILWLSFEEQLFEQNNNAPTLYIIQHFPHNSVDKSLIQSRSAQIQGRGTITNSSPQGEYMGGLLYQGQPFVDFLDLNEYPISEFSQKEFKFLEDRKYTYTDNYAFANQNPETHYTLSNQTHFGYHYHFECTKQACLAYEQEQIIDRNRWTREANEELTEIENVLKTRAQSILKDNLVKLTKSMLSLDTIARAGYGDDLLYQENLKNILAELQFLLIELSNIENDSNGYTRYSFCRSIILTE